jgi:hypothetical protein
MLGSKMNKIRSKYLQKTGTQNIPRKAGPRYTHPYTRILLVRFHISSLKVRTQTVVEVHPNAFDKSHCQSGTILHYWLYIQRPVSRELWISLDPNRWPASGQPFSGVESMRTSANNRIPAEYTTYIIVIPLWFPHSCCLMFCQGSETTSQRRLCLGEFPLSADVFV